MSNTISKTKPKQLMAFDFGTKHIGVAVGQTISESAERLTQLNANNGLPCWEDVDTLVNEWKPDALIIGLPLNMDGTPSHMSRRAKKFSNRLADRYHIPCHLVDERLSSVEAREKMAKKQSEIDSVAAAVILHSWFTQQNKAN